MLTEQCEHGNKGVKEKMLRSPVWLVGRKGLVQESRNYIYCGQIMRRFGFHILSHQNQNIFIDSEVV